MATRDRLKVMRIAALAVIAVMITASTAHARRPGRGRVGFGVVAGAAVGGFVAGAAVAGAAAAGAAVGGFVAGAAVSGGVFVPPPVVYEVHAPPPPPCCYQYAPPPPVVYAPRPPQPVVVMQPAPPPARRSDPVLGLALSGLVQSPRSGQLPVGGIAGALQLRTGPRSLLAVEAQSLGARRVSDDTRRSDLALLVGGRLFAWNAALAPYLDLSAGVGRASLSANDVEVRASQLVGRVGLGLELRLGRHLALEGQLTSVHRLRMDRDGSAPGSDPVLAIADHERSTELRAGVSFRF